MSINRTDRLNSLLKEVISDVIRKQVKNPQVSELTTVTRVEITKDLKYAKVYVSIIGEAHVRLETLKALQSAAGFIAVNASKQVVMRFFPSLTFKLDDSVDKQMQIESIIQDIQKERDLRVKPDDVSDAHAD